MRVQRFSAGDVLLRFKPRYGRPRPKSFLQRRGSPRVIEKIDVSIGAILGRDEVLLVRKSQFMSCVDVSYRGRRYQVVKRFSSLRRPA